MALLEAHGLEKWYGKRQVVKGVSYDVNAGEIVGLLGPNGAGKTTSFRMTTGQITPNGGRVLFDNREVTHHPMFRRARLGMGYLTQEPSIFRKLTVEQNIIAILEALPRSRTLGRKLTRSERWDRTEEALARFNLTHVRKNPSARCSGGEKRRLEIARCLVCEPLLILLDEPFAAVDPKTTEDIRANIRELAESGIGILLTDHNVREVVKTADRIYLIVDGKVVCHGTPDQIIRDKVAIDAYLGSTFEDDKLMARLAGFQKPETGEQILTLRPSENTPAPTPRMSAPLPVPPPVAPAPPPPAAYSGATQAILEQEKMRRLVEQLRDRETLPAAWHELATKGQQAIPVLLEALERRELELRHIAFKLLESLSTEPLVFQADAPEDVRLRQVAYLRAKLERKAG